MPKRGCSYGRKKSGKLQKNGTRRCYSKKEFNAKVRKTSKRIGSKGTKLQAKLYLPYGLKKWKHDTLDW